MLSLANLATRACLLSQRGQRLARKPLLRPARAPTPVPLSKTKVKPAFKLEFRFFHTSICSYQTHYEILGLKTTATQAEVIKAYRSKAKQYHPDLNKDPSAQAKFVAVKEAYECLKNPDRRAAYDSNISPRKGPTWTPPRPNPGGRQTYRTVHWDFEQDMKHWDSRAHAYRQAHQKQWEKERKAMDEEIRRSSEKDAVRRMLAPYFNVALILCLIGLGCTSLYIQYQARSRKSTRQNFAPDGEVPTYFSRPYRYEGPGTAHVVLEDSQSPSLDPHKKYSTRWDDVNDALRRRNDFYRQLLTPEDTRPPPTI